MGGEIIRNALRLVFLILVQGLIVNRLDLWQGYILPSVYIFGLLMLPITTPRIMYMVIGFVVGACVDMFTNTLGVHASACVFMGFIQPLFLRFLAPREGYEVGQRPTLQDLGIGWYITYAGIMALVHHTWLFYIELMRFTPFFYTLGKVLLSSLATLVLMVLGQYLIYSPTDRRKK